MAAVAAILTLAAVVAEGRGATVRTENFVVTTPQQADAQQFADTAEKLRRDLAVSWLGEELPNWSAPCDIEVTVGPRIGAGGATSFIFDQGEVFGWTMTIQGSRERIVDAVLPHEITHMLLASHFKRPIPRWADEGAGSSMDSAGERLQHHRHLVQCLKTRRAFPFETMMLATEYPTDLGSFYAQSFSASDYLLKLRGRRGFVRFLAESFRLGRQSPALRTVYGIESVRSFRDRWLAWVRQGSPPIARQVAVAKPDT